MFRQLARYKQKLTEEECEEVLSNALRGVLAVNGDDGYPYALPINFYYDSAARKIYFHSGKAGYKLDCLTRSDKASFTAMDEGVRHEGEWWLEIKSVIAFGRIERISDPEKTVEISRQLSHKFTQDDAYINREIEKYASATLLLALSIEDLCGKRVREK